MRVISGKYKARAIFIPKAVEIRPTQDRVRQALFNILGEQVIDADVLDLYAGSGAFGIEALSRGAQKVVFVDNDRSCTAAIKKTLLNFGCGEEAEILQVDALYSVMKLEREKKKFDIIFLDPPYHKEEAKNCLLKLNGCDILKNPSLIIIEHYKKDALPEGLNRLQLKRQELYGDTVLSFYSSE